VNEPKYAYRRDVLQHFRLIKRVGLQNALEILDKRWTCPECGGRIEFYTYVCADCDRSFLKELQNYEELEI
jgi:DNA-directed RNA polymerase subunit RPC12/RpoP